MGIINWATFIILILLSPLWLPIIAVMWILSKIFDKNTHVGRYWNKIDVYIESRPKFKKFLVGHRFE